VVCTCVDCGPLSVLCSGGLLYVVENCSPINGGEVLHQQYEHSIMVKGCSVWNYLCRRPRDHRMLLAQIILLPSYD
jgi:hypothetical protein